MNCPLAQAFAFPASFMFMQVEKLLHTSLNATRKPSIIFIVGHSPQQSGGLSQEGHGEAHG